MKKIKFLKENVYDHVAANAPKRGKIQLPKEEAVKRKIQEILRDDGMGHYHAKFARRLSEFFLYIVDHKKDPEMTAAISFDEGIIYMSDWFLLNINSTDETERQMCWQTVSALIRHELLHNLLMHEIRMIRELGDEAAGHIGTFSRTIGELENILMDMEISNKGYSDLDKQRIRELNLNNEIVGGIVAEDLRPGWETLTLEEMYRKILQESKLIAEYMHNNESFWGGSNELANYKNTYEYDRNRNRRNLLNIINTLTSMTAYRDEDALETLIYQPIENFKASNDYKKFKTSGLVKDLDEIIDSLVDVAKKLSQDDVEKLYKIVKDCDPVNELTLRNPTNNRAILTLYTPEEKFLAAAVLHSLVKYPIKKYWEERVQQVFTDLPQYAEFSKEDLDKILAGIK